MRSDRELLRIEEREFEADDQDWSAEVAIARYVAMLVAIGRITSARTSGRKPKPNTLFFACSRHQREERDQERNRAE